MDNLVLKLICAALVFVLYASCRTREKDDNMNDAYEQSATHETPAKKSETYESNHYGNRVGAEARLDSSANSKTPVDSYPE